MPFLARSVENLSESFNLPSPVSPKKRKHTKPSEPQIVPAILHIQMSMPQTNMTAVSTNCCSTVSGFHALNLKHFMTMATATMIDSTCLHALRFSIHNMQCRGSRVPQAGTLLNQQMSPSTSDGLKGELQWHVGKLGTSNCCSAINMAGVISSFPMWQWVCSAQRPEIVNFRLKLKPFPVV